MIETIHALPTRLKRGINEVPVHVRIDGEDMVSVIYVAGTFRKKPISHASFTNVYRVMQLAMGNGPYRLGAAQSALSVHRHTRLQDRRILVYRGMFENTRELERSRKSWKGAFNQRAIEAWYPVQPDKPEEYIVYHCLWIGELEEP